MKTKYFLILFIISSAQVCDGQDKTSAYRFHSINSLMLVNGSNAVSAALQSVNGFQKKNWFAGIGLGLDYYLYRTVPLFADFHYEFGKSKNKFFAYAGAGINFSWVQENSPGDVVIWDGNNQSNEFHNGYFSNAGLGYKIGTKKQNAFVLAFGYSGKSLKETKTYQDWRTGGLMTDKYNYQLNRIEIKMGWQF